MLASVTAQTYHILMELSRAQCRDVAEVRSHGPTESCCSWRGTSAVISY